VTDPTASRPSARERRQPNTPGTGPADRPKSQNTFSHKHSSPAINTSSHIAHDNSVEISERWIEA
jgi:hypothetical protein